MQTALVTEVLAALESHHTKDPQGAVAFDGDGTLWSGDIGEDFFEALLRDNTFHDVAHKALVHEAKGAGLDAAGNAGALCRRIHDAYVAGTFEEERMCEIMAWAFAGWQRAKVDAFAASVIENAKLEARFHRETMRVVEWARSRSIETYLVSASPRAIVEAAARKVGIPSANVIATREAVDVDDIVLANVERPIPYGAGKVAHLRQKMGTRSLLGAFGDNVFDVAMLQHAKTAVAIRPKARLIDRAGDVDGLVVLERIER